jgi:hypothetical protein
MNSFWKAKQSIPHTTVTFYGDCMKMGEDFAQSFGDKDLAVASRQRTVSHFFFTKKFFLPKTTLLSSTHHPTRLTWLHATFRFPAIFTELWRSRQNRRRCRTPSQNTTSRKHYKWQKRWKRCIRAEGDFFEGDGGQ